MNYIRHYSRYKVDDGNGVHHALESRHTKSTCLRHKARGIAAVLLELYYVASQEGKMEGSMKSFPPGDGYKWGNRRTVWWLARNYFLTL